MRNLVLSLTVTLVFVFYVFYERSGVTRSADNNVLVIAPNSSQTSNQTPSSTPAPTLTPVPTPASTPTPAPKPLGQYRDGSYTGIVADAYYGNVQVRVVIQNGQISNVRFLNYPQDRRTSQMINSQAMPYLMQEAITAQNANVDIVSGATATSGAFQQSLASALAQAVN